MAKDNKEGKIQFVFVNVEGDQDTLQEALRQVGNVLNRGMNPSSRTLIAVPAQRALAESNTNGSNAQEVYEVVEEVLPDDIVTSSTPISSDSKPRRQRKPPRIPALLKDFNPNSADVSFSDFVDQKDTSTHFNKYLVIGAWFKKYNDVDEITTSHIYTCYQFMKWTAPDDMSQPFRDMKKKHSYFEKGSKPKSWAITIIGLNEVDKMLARAAEED